MTAPRVSVVVPAYNAEATVGACVVALGQQRFDEPYEVIVIDDGSTDRTASVARDAGATVITTANSRPAAARNTGIHAAKGEIICCTDADCRPHGDWLRQITAPFQDPEIVACKGTYATSQKELVARFVQLEYEDKYDLLRRQASIDFIDTYSAAYRRTVLVANNGFDAVFDYLEDQELSFRLAARGYRMTFQESAVVEHIHSATVGDYMRKKFTIGYWKAQVVRRFPGRAAKDSHTPQIMKIQMILSIGLMANILLGTVAWIVLASQWQSGTVLALLPALITAIIFLVTTAPFVRKAWPKDRAVAALSPALLLYRALALSGGYAWGMVNPRRNLNGETTIGAIQYIAKRALDVVGALVGLLFTAILWPAVALLIKLDSAGPVIFRQTRVGERGEHFTMYKFRTMQVDAAEKWPHLVTSLGLSEPVLKLKDDPRLTRVGRMLRRRSLDECPQFWNVLRGEMSLVGPRPEEPRIVAFYTDYHRRRLSIRPGMTGPMQIDDRSEIGLDERVRLDLDYIENYSILRDIRILLRTIPVVIRGKATS